MTALVSIVTATWKRPRMLTERCIPSVWAQTYQPIEHLIVVDGRDVPLRRRLAGLGYSADGEVYSRMTRRVVELGRNHGGVGNAPRAVGAWLAAGEWVCYLDDDNEYLPGHVQAMMAEAERSGAALVCTAWRGSDGHVAGWAPPGTNRTDASSLLHRADLLSVASWAPEAGYAADGALVDRWVAAGVPWSFLPEPTMVYWGPRGGAPE